MRYRSISFIISTLTQNLIRTTFRNLKASGVRNCDEARKCRERNVSLDPEMQAKNAELKSYLLKEMYGHYRVIRMEQKARRILSDLFHSYTTQPGQLPPHIQQRTRRESVKRVVCDYLAGMTDRYAMEEYRKLFDPLQKV